MGLGPLFFARAFPCWVLWCSDSLTSPIFRSFFEILQLRWGGVYLTNLRRLGGNTAGSSAPGGFGRSMPPLETLEGRQVSPPPPHLTNRISFGGGPTACGGAEVSFGALFLPLF